MATYYAGFDRLDYPGDDAMQWLFTNTNLKWCGFYLAPAPSQGKGISWMTKLATLRSIGWGVAPVYLGQQTVASAPSGSHTLTAAQGKIDAQDAATLAKRAGFVDGSILFLDVEQGRPVDPGMLDYYKAWVAELVANTVYKPGVYCSFSGISGSLHDADSRPYFWPFNINHYTCNSTEASANRQMLTDGGPYPEIDPAGCGVPYARLWQHTQSNGNDASKFCFITIGGTRVSTWDFNSAVTADPSDPLTYPPVVTAISPACGAVAGGDTVVITGSGFSSATSVAFDATSAAKFQIDSDTQITAVSASGRGTIHITVVTSIGTSPAVTEDQFTYLADSSTATIPTVDDGPSSSTQPPADPPTDSPGDLPSNP